MGRLRSTFISYSATKQTGVRNQVELLMELIEEVELGNYDEKLKATDSRQLA
jgi:hypothetical protein